MLFTESTIACAADVADDCPRAAITAAPRFWIVSMNSPSSQARSVITSGTGRPAMRALAKSGYCVAEWLPQIATFVTSAWCTPAFFASWVRARFSSRRVIAYHRSAGMSGACDCAMRQLVLHGLPTTSTRTSLAACALIAAPYGPKMPPLILRRSPRSMPSLRGMEPTSRIHDAPSNATLGSEVASIPTSSGWALSSSSMTTPSSAPIAGSMSSRRSTTGWSGPRT